MTDLGSYLLMYMDGWARGANDKPPRFADPAYRKGHQDGLRDRYRAIELECERIGEPMSIETARSLIAEASSQPSAQSEPAMSSDPKESVSLAFAPLDPLSERFAEIRARHAQSMSFIPSGATIEPSTEHQSHALKYTPRKDDEPSHDKSASNGVSDTIEDDGELVDTFNF